MKSNHPSEQLIVFTRYPKPGTTKTRLAGTLGENGAAALQKRLTEHTMEQVATLLELRPVSVCVRYVGGSPKQMAKWLGPDFSYRKQESGDLGNRMAAAFRESFQRKFARTVIIGTDCPELQAFHMNQAFAVLHHKDLVLGPATDGGYYLIGLRRAEKSLFKNISWGSSTVLAETMAVATKKQLSLDLLELLNDVDRPEDLTHINNYSHIKRS
jgi:rSAM/selenodomain-associated transferase 1